MGFKSVIAPHGHFGRNDAEAAAGVSRNMSNYLIEKAFDKADKAWGDNHAMNEAVMAQRPVLDGTASLEDVLYFTVLAKIHEGSKIDLANIVMLPPEHGWGAILGSFFEGQDSIYVGGSALLPIVAFNKKQVSENTFNTGHQFFYGDMPEKLSGFVIDLHDLCADVLSRLAKHGAERLPALKPRPRKETPLQDILAFFRSPGHKATPEQTRLLKAHDAWLAKAKPGETTITASTMAPSKQEAALLDVLRGIRDDDGHPPCVHIKGGRPVSVEWRERLANGKITDADTALGFFTELRNGEELTKVVFRKKIFA